MTEQEYMYEFLHDYFTKHLHSRKKASEKTIQAYRQSINDFRKFMQEQKNIPFTKLAIENFSKDNVYDFLIFLRDQKHLKASSLNLKLAAIKSFVRYCGDEDPTMMAVYLSLARIHKFKDENRSSRVEYLTQDQLQLLFSLPDMDTRQGRRNQFIMIFLYETGARIDEYLNIKLSDIIWNDTVQVRLHGKGDKVRYIPVLEEVQTHLRAYLEEFHPESPKDSYLIYTVHLGKHTQMTEGTVNHLLKQYATQAEKSDARFPLGIHCHTMRHSVAMAMYKKGIPLTYIKDFLGHANLNSVAIYAHADDSTIAKAITAANENLVIDSTHEKKWKGHEQDLLSYCGLA